MRMCLRCPIDQCGKVKANSKLMVFALRTPEVMGTVIRLKRLLRLKTLRFGRPDLPMLAEARGCLTSKVTEEIGLLEQRLRRSLAVWRWTPQEGSA